MQFCPNKDLVIPPAPTRLHFSHDSWRREEVSRFQRNEPPAALAPLHAAFHYPLPPHEHLTLVLPANLQEPVQLEPLRAIVTFLLRDFNCRSQLVLIRKRRHIASELAVAGRRRVDDPQKRRRIAFAQRRRHGSEQIRDLLTG